MKQQLIADVLQGMLNVLDNAQLKQLESTLHRVIEDYEVESGQQKRDNDGGLLGVRLVLLTLREAGVCACGE